MRQGALLPVAGRSRHARGACSSRRSGCRIRSSSASRRRSSPSRSASRCRASTRVLIAELKGVGRDYPAVDREALPRALATTSWPTGAKAASAASRFCATAAWATRCRSTRGTTQVILEFGLKKPAFRIVVNTPTTHGSIGLTTGLDPAMTLGCGGYGGNITSDNISPRHLLNIKRLAYELRPAVDTHARLADAGAARRAGPAAAARSPARAARRRASTRRSMRSRSTSLLADRQRRPAAPQRCGSVQAVVAISCAKTTCGRRSRLGRKIVIGERTIVTPAARDLAEAHRVFVTAGWPRA